ncbi:IS66 family transposase [Rhabdochromatium marinum]|uniref:IS66 family transposase n=1 Tax=Rhabdochromatium marinum TaxID=48729 RepID=UPI001905F1D2|nr:transposase [Rhabdochromatium marinum]MBK1650307.1 hypothetical protein [Rhabdochromatium marinum]
MHLSDHSLSQLDKAYVQALDEARLRGLSLRLLDDLKEARERLRQNPTNSSRPPSSRALWDRPSAGDERDADETEDEASLSVENGEVPEKSGAADTTTTTHPQDPPESPETPALEDPSPKTAKPKRNPGKPLGAPGFGRTQILKAHETQHHHPLTCEACVRAFLDDAPSVAYAGFQSVDLVWGHPEQQGLLLHVTDHRLYETGGACGHQTHARVGEESVDDPTLDAVRLSEWRLVGPGLATLIVALREAAAAAAPLEKELIQAVVDSDWLHADETSWPQGAEVLWLWVFTRATVTLFAVGKRRRDVLDRILSGFTSWLMSDGWPSYRHLPQRLRCWVHLTRKAQAFGHQVQNAFDTLIGTIHGARDGPPVDLRRLHANLLAQLHAACVRLLGHWQAKTRALALSGRGDR